MRVLVGLCGVAPIEASGVAAGLEGCCLVTLISWLIVTCC